MDTKKKILIVEDDELAQEFLRYYLSKSYEVHVSKNVVSFYKNIEANIFDAILMDVFLKDVKTGLDLTKELRADKRHKDTPIIIMTAHNTTADRRNAFESGATKFLNKPVDLKTLKANIEELFVTV
jgi:DNA-binding response OmpR family regulator